MIESKEKTCSDAKQPILVHDVIRSILERLSFVDFHRARCVSSAWYSASKSCMGVTNPKTPWIILFPDGNSCKLYDPLDHKSYTIKDDHLGFDFATSRCLASSGSWFLMLVHRSDFYLVNLFTRERLPLPSMESFEDVRVGSAVLWVDETSRDYLVVWSSASSFAYYKKGDNNQETWKLLNPFKNHEVGCVDMVFKQGKLYVLGTTRNVTVVDFSGSDSPMECASLPPTRNFLHRPHLNNIAVTLSGEILIIASVELSPGRRIFNVFKLDPKSSAWISTNSIGDQVLLLDLGITVAAKDGVMRNCIYFSLCKDDNRLCVYHINTGKVIQVFDHLTASSPIHFKDARWFFPTFGGRWLH
ncbi:LOW QUALITY PROTEIN: F-box protein KIB4-like [Eutrema salsugineum]|uniref:LOW QUALITY PROTEIN: F-box protein KIB4-like n=1 Tax=Eutrema salsugineum TaxID=72664 RepID=UPI000CED2461|nr:LOW QUALITY PROTEIN: F-box protein KIB4-like [Eutrema salsugineum]